MLERYKRKSYEFAQNILENRRYWEWKKFKRRSVGYHHEIFFSVYRDVCFMYCAKLYIQYLLQYQNQKKSNELYTQEAYALFVNLSLNAVLFRKNLTSQQLWTIMIQTLFILNKDTFTTQIHSNDAVTIQGLRKKIP